MEAVPQGARTNAGSDKIAEAPKEIGKTKYVPRIEAEYALNLVNSENAAAQKDEQEKGA